MPGVFVKTRFDESCGGAHKPLMLALKRFNAPAGRHGKAPAPFQKRANIGAPFLMGSRQGLLKLKRLSARQTPPIHGRSFCHAQAGQAHVVAGFTRLISLERQRKGDGYLHLLSELASLFHLSQPEVAAVNRFIRGFPCSQTERVSLSMDRSSFWHALGASILNRDPGAGFPVGTGISTCPYTMTSRSLSSRGVANGGNAGGLSKVTGTHRFLAKAVDAKCFNI